MCSLFAIKPWIRPRQGRRAIRERPDEPLAEHARHAEKLEERRPEHACCQQVPSPPLLHNYDNFAFHTSTTCAVFLLWRATMEEVRPLPEDLGLPPQCQNCTMGSYQRAPGQGEDFQPCPRHAADHRATVHPSTESSCLQAPACSAACPQRMRTSRRKSAAWHRNPVESGYATISVQDASWRTQC